MDTQKPENILLNRGRCEEASRKLGIENLLPEGPDCYAPEPKACKNCGRPRVEHVRISFGGNIYNDWCPVNQEGNPWGSTRTIWREV